MHLLDNSIPKALKRACYGGSEKKLAKRFRVEYNTKKYTGLIDPVRKKDSNLDLKSKNNTKNQKQMCVGGSDKRIGFSWHQFSENLEDERTLLQMRSVIAMFLDIPEVDFGSYSYYSSSSPSVSMMGTDHAQKDSVGAITGIIEHICSNNLNFQFIEASFIKNVDISDHFFVNSVCINSEKPSKAKIKKKVNRKLITLKSDKIINHKYYAVLTEHIESTLDTSTLVSDTILKTNNTLNELKINNRLAQTTSIRNNNFNVFPLSKIGVFSECNITPTWNDITKALKITPNNKAAVQDETEPKSHLATLINKLINKAWNKCNLIGTNNTSVVVLIIKSENRQNPNNYQGISLIPTLTKLISKLVAIKLNKLDLKYNILCKEQAGFRTKEECIAQATTLYEIIKRRKLAKLKTYIDGKLLQVIKGLYHAPRLAVKINNEVFDAKKIKTFKSYMGCYTVATHGGKLFGMSATRCKPVQQVVDAATRTLAKCGKSAAMVRLRQELSLTDLNIKTAVARTRAFGKWASLKTWISDLINQWQALRANILAQDINIMIKVATKPHLFPASISMSLVCKLLGEVLKLPKKISSHQQPDREGQYSLYGGEQQSAQQAQAMGAQNIECDNPHKRVRALMVEVESYPRLIETISSLETNFFRSPIPEKKRKEIIYECSKFLRMKYTPHPLNKAATPAVCTNNAALYGIQMALANMTKPIDDYVHKKLKDPAIRIKGNADLEFAHLMRELLFDVTSNITQARIKNFYKLMELLGKHPKRPQQRTVAERGVPFVCASRMCMTQHLQRRILLKTPSKPQPIQQITPRRIRADIFRQRKKTKALSRATNVFPLSRINFYVLSSLYQAHRQQIVIQYGLPLPVPLILHSHCYKLNINRRSSNAITKEVAALLAKRAIEQSNINHTKKDKRPTSSPGSQKAQQLCRREDLQNIITNSHM
ncbi:hypothetical protein BB561_005155 [Smittium simulii]|uniref:Reverse transcriptase domain-containing protein n=1 Tax=Smittium simulii TaxID=133385 RepID=A0A2T9YBU9_9FUNG|nr:hypothetical protein BB561_005155 [Smittium simulii]